MGSPLPKCRDESVGGECLSGEPLTISSAQTRDFEYIYCKELGRAINRAAKAPITGTTAINAGNGDIVTFEGVVEVLRSVLPDLQLKITPADGLSQSIKQPLDLSRSKALFDWAPEFSMANAFRDYVEESKRAG